MSWCASAETQKFLEKKRSTCFWHPLNEDNISRANPHFVVKFGAILKAFSFSEFPDFGYCLQHLPSLSNGKMQGHM